jgi:transposase
LAGTTGCSAIPFTALAQASANLYSLIETAKLNGLEPYAYFCHVFEQLPKAQTLNEIERLLPWQVNKGNFNVVSAL